MPRTYTNLRYHVVFSTKMRLPVLVPELRRELYPYIGGIVTRSGGLPIAINGVEDHVHLLVGLRPDPSLSKIVQLIKGGSSNWINKTERLPNRFAWQEGYSAFTVSESQILDVRRYIERQEEHHQKMSWRDEMARLLRKNKIAFAAGDFEH